MSFDAAQLLSDLSSRLPELEWKVNELGSAFSSHNLPRGLFRAGREANGAGCIAEIKADITALAQQKQERSAEYLAERIQRKVNVLVKICQMHNRKPAAEKKAYFGVKMLSTRQQWIRDLEVEISLMEKQQQAMYLSLEQMMRRSHAPDTVLQLKAELGKIEQRITLAKETLARATS